MLKVYVNNRCEKSQMNTPKILYVVSDGTGETAEKVLLAGLKQFRFHNAHVIKIPNVTHREKLQSIIQTVSQQDALILFTLVEPGMRIEAKELAEQHRVRYIDLLDNLLSQLSIYLRQQPDGVPNQMHPINDEYFRRVEAVEFTVRGDDGKNPPLLTKADIVLVGVSRTSKTPLSVFLAHKGYKVCNVPIVLDKPLPASLTEVDQRCIFALTISPETLQEIRRKRLRTMKMQNRHNYGDMHHIISELDWADNLYRSNPTWPVIDVTQRAVEETASIILGILNDRGLTHTHSDISQL